MISIVVTFIHPGRASSDYPNLNEKDEKSLRICREFGRNLIQKEIGV